jgi:hypothetical protein
MKTARLNSVLAMLCLFWAAAVSIAIMWLGTGHRPSPDLTLCPLCDQPVLIAREDWKLHPDTP